MLQIAMVILTANSLTKPLIVYGKSPPRKLPSGRLPPTLNLTKTLTLTHEEFIGGQSSRAHFYRGQFSDHGL